MIEIKRAEFDISLKWFLIRYCNFNCPNCIEGNSNTRKFSKEMLQQQTEQAKLVGDKILSFIRSYRNKNIKLTLTGGECSLVDLEYVFKNWNNIGEGNTLDILMITNFSASTDKYKQFFETLDDYGIKHKMTVSIHESQWENSNYLINKVIDMKDDIACVNYVITNSNSDIILKYFNALHPYVEQRIGVERNKNVEYQISKEVWDIIKSQPVKKQMMWIEDGKVENLDMDTMLNERVSKDGFFGWHCYPIIKINSDGSAFICRNTPIELEHNKIPNCIICQRHGKCTPYNFVKVSNELFSKDN